MQVIWNGNTGTKPEAEARAPLLHARLVQGAKAFSIQQNLSDDTTARDGGASIAANQQGRVAVVWHAAPAGQQDENARRVWVQWSDNDGATFSAATPLNNKQPRVCACCSLRAYLSADGTLSVLYRAAMTPADRGRWLITSTPGQSTPAKLDDWRIAACPMGKLPVWSYAAAYARPDGVFTILF